MKIKICPKCKSSNIKLQIPQTNTWKCQKCGYEGSLIIEKEVNKKHLQ